MQPSRNDWTLQKHWTSPLTTIKVSLLFQPTSAYNFRYSKYIMCVWNIQLLSICYETIWTGNVYVRSPENVGVVWEGNDSLHFFFGFYRNVVGHFENKAKKNTILQCVTLEFAVVRSRKNTIPECLNYTVPRSGYYGRLGELIRLYEMSINFIQSYWLGQPLNHTHSLLHLKNANLKVLLLCGLLRSFSDDAVETL